MNAKEWKIKVNSACYALIKEKGVVSSVEVLLAIGVLSKERYEDWRFGRVPFLERVCDAGLGKLSAINHEIRVFAQKNGLKPSWTDYRQWGKGQHNRLRFSKSGDARIEELYATHYVCQRKVAEAQERREFRKRAEALARTIAPCGLICGLCSEAPGCKGCRDEGGCARAAVCHQRTCCAEKGLAGCWQCGDFPCDQDMFAPERDVRLKAFVRCAKENGLNALAGHLLRNLENGVLYHRDKRNHTGDYDGLGGEEAVLNLLRKTHAERTDANTSS